MGLITGLNKGQDLLCSEEEDPNNDSKLLDFSLCKEDKRGKPFDKRVRDLIYTCRAHNVGIAHIEPIVKAALSLVNVKVKDFPSQSVIALMSKEMPKNLLMSQLGKEILQHDKELKDHDYNRNESESKVQNEDCNDNGNVVSEEIMAQDEVYVASEEIIMAQDEDGSDHRDESEENKAALEFMYKIQLLQTLQEQI
jgi:hypothetical protein